MPLRARIGPWAIGAVVLVILGGVAWIASATAAAHRASMSTPSKCAVTGPSPLRLDGCDLRGVDLRKANLHRASLRGAQLDGAQLRHKDLQGVKASGASF